MLSPSDGTRAAFDAWRRMSPAHAAAYARVASAHDEARALAAEAPLLTLRHETLARTMLVRKTSRAKPRALAGAVLLLAVAPLAAYGIETWGRSGPARVIGQTFHTGVGQKADVTLPDGSVVTLDTASKLEVRFTRGERRVVLDGQGWFRLKRSARPFLISAGGHSFTTEQGSFDLRADTGEVRAFAAEGLLTLAGESSSVMLEPGHMLEVKGNDVLIHSVSNPATLIAWRQGLLQLDDVPLAEAAGELNRYRRRPIRIADNHAAGLRVSGTFQTAETPAFVDALTAGFPVRVKQDTNESIIIASR